MSEMQIPEGYPSPESVRARVAPFVTADEADAIYRIEAEAARLSYEELVVLVFTAINLRMKELHALRGGLSLEDLARVNRALKDVAEGRYSEDEGGD